ncbi:MAG: phosphoglucomutase [Roseiflexus castenholzii]|uniref:phosphoglucomutase n=1 Tax=Roseiflexus castenholzii TaxID=120962 RepID=UPI000CCB5B31|nr:MAG: phosphoglucomutase [Roseiflexus castenholzii]
MHTTRYTYCWEGVVAADFTLGAVRRRYPALADLLNARGWSCLVAYDTRFLSAQIAADCYQGLRALGARVVLSSTPLPRPAVDVALDQGVADCAVIVSAGNRDYWSNGLIIIAPAPGLDPFVDGDLPAECPPFPSEPSDADVIDVRRMYIESLRQTVDIDLARQTSLTIFVDAMNGTTGGIIPATLGDGAQTKTIEINREADAWFGRQAPHPHTASLVRLRKLVRESDSHLGVALSADGRALGVVDNDGELAPHLDIALLLAQYLNRQYRWRGLVIVPAPAASAAWVRAWEAQTGLSVEFAERSATRIAEARAAHQLLIGVTEDGQPTFGRNGGIGDAPLAALLLIELVARRNVKLRVLREKLRQSPGM